MREYGVYFEDGDEQIIEVMEKINDHLDEKYNKIYGEIAKIFFDVLDIYDHKEFKAILDFNKYNGEDEFRIMDIITNYADEIGVKVTFDTHPDVDECSMYNFSYSAIVQL